MKKILSLFVLFVVSLLATSMVSAVGVLPISIEELKVNGDEVTDENLYVEKGETLNLKIKLENTGNDTVEGIQVEAAIKGYEYSDADSLEDATDLFDLDAGDTRWVSLSVSLPNKLDKDLYLLRIRIVDKNSEEVRATYNLKVNPTRHALAIKDVLFSPGTTIKAGHSLLATVLVDNFGGKDEKDVKVTLEVPELGVSAADYIDVVESSDKKTSEELFLRLPACAAEGDYQAKVTLEYNEGDDMASKDFTLSVVADEKCRAEEQKLVITVGPESQNVVAGQQAVYPVALTNAGTSAKTYILDFVAGEWATASVSENLVVLEPGKTKVVFAYLTATGKTAGENVATLNIKSGDSVLKTIYLKANVVPQQSTSSFNLRNSLEIALIVLVVVLVIVGLILGFSRLKKNEGFEEEEKKTYY